MLLLGRKTALERLASFLLILMRRMRLKGNHDRVLLPMTRTDIADHLGLTIETVSRCFSKLKRERIIRFVTAQDLQIVAPKRLAPASAEAVAALRRGETTAWSPDPGEIGLTGLASPTGAKQVGPLLLAPLRAPSGALLAALGAALPAGQTDWPAAHTAWLTGLAEPLTEAWQQLDQPRHAAQEALAAAFAERDAAR